MILFWGAILITEAHGPATLVRVFESKTTPKRVRYLVAAWACILVPIAIASMYSLAIAQVFTKITLLWAVQHYIAQTFGIVLIYCFKRGHTLDRFERFIFQGLMRSIMYFVLIRMLTLPAYGHLESFMGMEVPFWGPLPPIIVNLSQFIMALFAVAFLSLVTGRLIVKKQFFPLPGLLAIVTVAAVLFQPRNGLYLLGVTFFHSSQYLAIAFSYFLKEKALAREGKVPDNLLPHFVSKRSLLYFLGTVALGYLGTVTMVNLLTQGAPPNTALILCTMYSLFNCHHYLSDALVWRIRDPKVKQLLV